VFHSTAPALQRRPVCPNVLSMAFRAHQVIDMTPSGEFLPRSRRLPLTARVGIAAALIAVACAIAAAAAIFLWLASILLPVALIAAAVAYGAFKLQLWRVRAG
jgi:hypothetical protein